MIEEPPLLTIRARTRRPTAEQVAALAAYPTGMLADAMGGRGALPAEIAPLAPGELPDRMAGVALTCECGPADLLALSAALTEVRPGDVIVAATGGWRGGATFGDRVAGMAANGGAAGIVSDGLARDRAGLVGVGLPIFCAGLNPNSPFASGPGTVGLPVVIGDRTVESGDILVGDRDGVVVIPFAQVEALIARAAEVLDLETALDAKVATGLSAPDAMREPVAGPRVRRL